MFEDDEQRARAAKMNPGKDPARKLGLHDMAAGPVLFSATGVTTGALLRGVRFYPHQVVTHSLVMRSSSGTSRFIEAHHNLSTKVWPAQ